MTNNPTIDGVSRRLLELSAQCLSNSGYEMAHAELRALLAAPVVERQESVVFGYVIPGSFPVVSGYTSTANPVNEGKYTQPVYTAPPQLAELQAEIKHLLHASVKEEVFDAVCKERDELQATIERLTAQILSMRRELHALVPDGYTNPDANTEPTNKTSDHDSADHEPDWLSGGDYYYCGLCGKVRDDE